MSEPTRYELLKGIVTAIDRFDRACKREGYTDTGDALTLLNAIRAAAKLAIVTPDETAASLGRRGGKKGGKARAANLSAAERSAISSKAARARWDKKR